MAALTDSTCRARSDHEQRDRSEPPRTRGESELQPGERIARLAGAAVESQSQQRWGKRILLIDDDPQVLASVALLLEGEGYEVVLASNGFDALARCQRCRPNLVLIDLNIPLRDGWATLESIEELRPLIPMIVITAKPLQYERAIAFGVDALMEKPLDFPVLLAVVEALLREPINKRLARLTNKDFKTINLSSKGASE
jgi:DNA-binding response OmpR family regulator